MIQFFKLLLQISQSPYLSVIGKSKGSGEERVAGVNTDLHGVLGIDELEEHVQELPFIGRGSHQVPVFVE